MSDLCQEKRKGIITFSLLIIMLIVAGTVFVGKYREAYGGECCKVEKVCDDKCCDDDEECCGEEECCNDDKCCEPDFRPCCDGECCPTGYECCGGDKCCGGIDGECCGDECCTNECCGNDCCAGPSDEYGCCGGCCSYAGNYCDDGECKAVPSYPPMPPGPTWSTGAPWPFCLPF